MYVVDVIPIARSARKDSLTYLSKNRINPGSVVEVPLRKQIVPALVLHCNTAQDVKSTIKSSSFQLKKVRTVYTDTLLTRACISAITQTAEHFASNVGQMFFALTPSQLLLRERSTKKQQQDKAPDRKKMSAWFVLQEDQNERCSQYRRLVRESFSKKQSVYICVPSMQDGEFIYEHISKGIQEYAFLFHSGISKKKLEQTWDKALSSEHPVVIIGTAMFLSLPRSDIRRIIIEKESSEGYRTVSNPRIDMRIYIEYFSKEQKAELIFADSLLRLQTLHRLQTDNIKTITPLSFRALTSAHAMLFDMTEENAPIIFHEHPDTLIRSTKEKNEHTFVFAARKGLAPLTVCQDCGHIVTTSDGSAPMVLYEHPEGNYFYSPHTKEKRPADETCSYCGGWRLKPLGLGIDTIEKEIRRIAPKTTILRLDKDTVSTHKKARELVKTFYATPGAILIGTELACHYLTETVDNIIVTTIDSLLALPDFQIQEKALRTLLSLRAKAGKKFIVQTRNPEQHIFNYAIEANAEKMLREELESRKKYKFPPYTTLIKITLTGPEDIITAHAEEIVRYLDETEADIYPAHIAKVRGLHVLNILLRIDPQNWPDHVLADKLRSLPENYTVQVHPENIL